MYNNIRIISRLDVKGENVVKGVHFEGLRIMGKPEILAKKYNDEGIDELIYIDSVASLYGRNNLIEIVEKTANQIRIPITVGGGIRTIEDIKNLLRCGADKVAINTQAVKKPEFITQAAHKFGSQCVILSVEAKKISQGKWEAYTDNGREPTGLNVVEWVHKGEQLGAGEILLTSIDREGTKKGFDIELYQEVFEKTTIPLIASGGAGNIEDIIICANSNVVNAIALASVLHYNENSVLSVKKALTTEKYPVRNAFIGESKLDNSINQQVSIVDCGVGNLFSIIKSLESIGVRHHIISSPEEILKAERIILPGVGSFLSAMDELKSKGYTEAICDFVKKGNPLMGICLGAQILMSRSEEFGNTAGLDLIPGSVISLKQFNLHSKRACRVPHMGWSKLVESKDNEKTGLQNLNLNYELFSKRWKGSILENVPIGVEVYFAHSYKIVPDDRSQVLSVCFYGEQEICAVIQNENIVGCQFHPEKSGNFGMEILIKFCGS